MRIAIALAFTLAIAKCSIRQIDVEIIPKDVEGVAQQRIGCDIANFCRTDQECQFWPWSRHHGPPHVEEGYERCCCNSMLPPAKGYVQILYNLISKV